MPVIWSRGSRKSIHVLGDKVAQQRRVPERFSHSQWSFSGCWEKYITLLWEFNVWITELRCQSSQALFTSDRQWLRNSSKEMQRTLCADRSLGKTTQSNYSSLSWLRSVWSFGFEMDGEVTSRSWEWEPIPKSFSQEEIRAKESTVKHYRFTTL